MLVKLLRVLCLGTGGLCSVCQICNQNITREEDLGVLTEELIGQESPSPPPHSVHPEGKRCGEKNVVNNNNKKLMQGAITLQIYFFFFQLCSHPAQSTRIEACVCLHVLLLI